MLNESMMHDLNMEYYNPKTRTPFSSIAYHPAENEFYHQWSIESVGEYYGYHKLSEVIPVRDYLLLPNCIVDEFVKAVSNGLDKRDKVEKERRREQNPGGFSKDQLELLKAAGLDVGKLGKP